MKLQALLVNREALTTLYQTKVDGKRALKLRKAIKKLGEELETFDEAKNEKIRELGEEDEQGNIQITPGTDAYNEVMQYLNEMTTSEIDDPEPILTEDDLETLDLSVQEIDQIEALGLLKGA